MNRTDTATGMNSTQLNPIHSLINKHKSITNKNSNKSNHKPTKSLNTTIFDPFNNTLLSTIYKQQSHSASTQSIDLLYYTHLLNDCTGSNQCININGSVQHIRSNTLTHRSCIRYQPGTSVLITGSTYKQQSLGIIHSYIYITLQLNNNYAIYLNVSTTEHDSIRLSISSKHTTIQYNKSLTHITVPYIPHNTIATSITPQHSIAINVPELIQCIDRYIRQQSVLHSIDNKHKYSIGNYVCVNSLTLSDIDTLYSIVCSNTVFNGLTALLQSITIDTQESHNTSPPHDIIWLCCPSGTRVQRLLQPDKFNTVPISRTVTLTQHNNNDQQVVAQPQESIQPAEHRLLQFDSVTGCTSSQFTNTQYITYNNTEYYIYCCDNILCVQQTATKSINYVHYSNTLLYIHYSSASDLLFVLQDDNAMTLQVSSFDANANINTVHCYIPLVQYGILQLNSIDIHSSGLQLCLSGTIKLHKQCITIIDLTNAVSIKQYTTVIHHTHTYSVHKLIYLSRGSTGETMLLSCGTSNVRIWRLRHATDINSAKLNSATINLHRHLAQFNSICMDSSDPQKCYIVSDTGCVYSINVFTRMLDTVHKLYSTSIHLVQSMPGYILVCDCSGTLRIYAVEDMKDYAVQIEVGSLITSLSINSTYTQCGIASYHSIHQLDLHTNQLTVLTHSIYSTVQCIAHNHLSDMLVVCTDTSIKIYQLSTLDIQAELIHHSTAIPVCCRVLINHLVIGYNTGVMCVYDISTASYTVLYEYMQHQQPVVSIQYNTNATLVYTVGADNIVVLYDVINQYTPIYTYNVYSNVTAQLHPKSIVALHTLRDVMSTALSDTTHQPNTTTAALQQHHSGIDKPPNHNQSIAVPLTARLTQSLAISPDNNTLALIAADQCSVMLLDSRTLQYKSKFTLPNTRHLIHVRYMNDTCMVVFDQHGTTTVVSCVDYTATRTIHCNTSSALCTHIEYTPINDQLQYIIGLYNNHTLHITSVTDTRHVTQIYSSHNSIDCMYNMTHQKLIVASHHTLVQHSLHPISHTIDTVPPEPSVSTVQPLVNQIDNTELCTAIQYKPQCIAWHSSTGVLTYTHHQQYIIDNLLTNQLHQLNSSNNNTGCIQYSADGQYIALCMDNTITVYNTQSMDTTLSQLQLNHELQLYHTHGIQQIQYSTTGDVLVSLSQNYNNQQLVTIWDYKTNYLSYSVVLPYRVCTLLWLNTVPPVIIILCTDRILFYRSDLMNTVCNDIMNNTVPYTTGCVSVDQSHLYTVNQHNDIVTYKLNSLSDIQSVHTIKQDAHNTGTIIHIQSSGHNKLIVIYNNGIIIRYKLQSHKKQYQHSTECVMTLSGMVICDGVFESTGMCGVIISSTGAVYQIDLIKQKCVARNMEV